MAKWGEFGQVISFWPLTAHLSLRSGANIVSRGSQGSIGTSNGEGYGDRDTMIVAESQRSEHGDGGGDWRN